jgi:hypothetical protein
MTTHTASAVVPVARRAIGLAPEPAPGQVTLPTYTFPSTTFTPVDKITYLEDMAWRNAMAALYNVIQGVRIADVSMGGPFFCDGIGHPLTSILGDYWQSVNGTAGTATTLSSGSAIGATSISTANSVSANTVIAIGALGTNAEEVRTVTNVSGSGPYTLTLSSALYQAHGSGVAVTPYSAVTNYTHNWALLNSGTGAGGWAQAQPRTYTLTDYTGVPATVGARQYAYAVWSEVTITSNPAGLLDWDSKITAFASAIAGSTPTIAPTAVPPQAAWDTSVTIGGTPIYNNSEFKLTLARKLEPMYTNSGQQDPSAIPRGTLAASVGMNFDPAFDESQLNYYLQNTQPTLVLTANNNLAGAAQSILTITANQAAFNTAAITDQKEVFGFDQNALLVANTTNVGPSGGYSPLTISLTNAVVSY